MRMWKITTTKKINIILIIQYFALKFIPCRFYILKIAKKNFLSCVQKMINNIHPLCSFLDYECTQMLV